jgi:hypothetical protein
LRDKCSFTLAGCSLPEVVATGPHEEYRALAYAVEVIRIRLHDPEPSYNVVASNKSAGTKVCGYPVHMLLDRFLGGRAGATWHSG